MILPCHPSLVDHRTVRLLVCFDGSLPAMDRLPEYRKSIPKLLILLSRTCNDKCELRVKLDLHFRNKFHYFRLRRGPPVAVAFKVVHASMSSPRTASHESSSALQMLVALGALDHLFVRDLVASLPFFLQRDANRSPTRPANLDCRCDVSDTCDTFVLCDSVRIAVVTSSRYNDMSVSRNNVDNSACLHICPEGYIGT